MDDDTRAIVVGLSAGIGGFVGFLVALCICWQIFCGSWCDKEKVRQPARPIPVRTQQRSAANGFSMGSTAVTPMPSKTASSVLQSDSSSDLASKLKSARR